MTNELDSRASKTGKPGIPPRERRARGRPAVAPFAAGWGLDAGAETGPEAANLTAGGGESGRGPARAGKIPGAERRGRQNFSFPKKRTLRKLR